MPAMQTFHPRDRPEINLRLEDGTLVDADLHAWQARGDEQWAVVVWTAGGQTWRDTVPGDRVRPFELNAELRGVLAFTARAFPDDETRDAAIHDELQISPTRYGHQVAWLRHLHDGAGPGE